jgi:hypothetical protein
MNRSFGVALAGTYKSITGITRASATVRPRESHHQGQVGGAEYLSGLCHDATPEPGGVTVDKVAGTGHLRPRGRLALHHADREPDRGREVAEQVARGPAGTRRWPLPVAFAEPGEDGGEKSSP